MGDPIELTLRLEPGEGVPSGEVVALGATRRFQGWLELLRRLEEARSESRPHDGPGGDPDLADETRHG